MLYIRDAGATQRDAEVEDGDAARALACEDDGGVLGEELEGEVWFLVGGGARDEAGGLAVVAADAEEGVLAADEEGVGGAGGGGDGAADGGFGGGVAGGGLETPLFVYWSDVGLAAGTRKGGREGGTRRE